MIPLNFEIPKQNPAKMLMVYDFSWAISPNHPGKLFFISQVNRHQSTFEFQSIPSINFNHPAAQPFCLPLAPPFQALPLTPFDASSQRSSVVSSTLITLVDLDERGLVVAKVQSLQWHAAVTNGNKGLWWLFVTIFGWFLQCLLPSFWKINT